jgi:hypothetical protein
LLEKFEKMSLKSLIENQIIMIDDHYRGANEWKNWDDQTKDIHIDKITYIKIEGKIQKIQIKVPINSSRPIKIINKRGKLNEIPHQISKEIKLAFEDKKRREAFLIDIIKVLKNFPTILENEKRVRKVLENLSKHFDLEWSGQIISIYTNEVLEYYAQLYFDKLGKEYFISVDKKRIEIGQKKGYSRFFKKTTL